MYKLKNGILHHNNQAVFALGQSYYPSYHPKKHPVPPECDRLAEMEQDLKEIEAAGFNLVRTAALGEVKRDGENVTTDFPFIDTMCENAEKNDLAMMVRLQGYGFNLSGAKDYTMLNEKDEEMPFFWGWFVRHCLNHPGVIRDDTDATIASATHFKDMKSVVGFQIYNEAAYPTKGLYDYHPYSIAAWREWLVEQGIKTPAEATELEPPRCYPLPGENPSDWMNWRLFHLQRLNNYLNYLSDKAKEGYPEAETVTCHMPCPLQPGSSIRGQDYFRIAEGMDMVGLTIYYGAKGEAYFFTSQVLALAESAAATYGKHAWIIEYSAATRMDGDGWDCNTYAAVGAGMKGLVYYQWRGDHPYPETPEPDRFGMIYSDKRKTEKFDRAVAMTKLIGEIGHYFVEAEKMRSGVAILYSENVNAWCDAVENTNPENKDGNVSMVNVERNAGMMAKCYQDFAKAGVSVDFTRAQDLAENRLGVKVLVIGLTSGLSEQEKSDIEAFKAKGGIVVEHDQYSVPLGYIMDDKRSLCPEQVLTLAEIEPMFTSTAPYLMAGILEGEKHYAISIVNYDILNRVIPDGTKLNLNLKKDITSAEYITPNSRMELDYTVSGNLLSITLPEIKTGCFLILNKKL